nr:immunoglobulin heavy chain junction region [Mus musculus]
CARRGTNYGNYGGFAYW